MSKRQDSSHSRGFVRGSNVTPNCERRPARKPRPKAGVSATYWEPWDDLDIAEWIMQGRRLGSIGRGVAWWIGDWVNYGNTKFGEKYSRAARITGYDVQSLMNMAYVASRFGRSRRRENLSWSHHAELAGLAIEQQEVWLENAEKNHLTVHGLRDEVRTWRARLMKRAIGDGDQRPADTAHADGVVVCPKCGYSIANGKANGKANGNNYRRARVPS
jgi:hypothetical protein